MNREKRRETKEDKREKKDQVKELNSRDNRRQYSRNISFSEMQKTIFAKSYSPGMDWDFL